MYIITFFKVNQLYLHQNFYMKKLLLILFICISSLAFTSNPPTQSVLKGTVLDVNTTENLAGCKIEIEGVDTQFYSDLDGNFLIQLQPGKYNITFSMISYNKSYIEGFTLIEKQEENIEVKLR